MSNKLLEDALAAVDRHADDAGDGRWLEDLVTGLAPEIAAWDLSAAWLWKDWPHRTEVLGEGSRPSDDGIDVVARRQDGGWCAIQCKARKHVNGRPGRLVREDVDGFLAATRSDVWAECWIVTNAEIARHGQAKMRGLGAAVAHAREIRIEPAIRDEIAAREAARPDPRDAMQEKAVGEILRGLDNVRATADKAHAGWRPGESRATAVMPCGTGKTRVAYEVSRRSASDGLVCVLAPSIGLVRQLRTAWLGWAKAGGETLRTLSVCSDARVAESGATRREREEAQAGQDEDPIEDRSLVSTAELAGTVEADAPGIARWLADDAGASGARPVIFCTYQSGHHLAEALRARETSAALLVCDEAHRTSGIRRARTQGQAARIRDFLLCHDAEQMPARDRLYMTATPRAIRRGDRLPSDLQVSTMDDEAVFGPVAFRLTYREAVEQELLSDYRIIAVAVSREGCTVGEQLAQATRDRIESESDVGELDDARRTSTSLAIRKVAFALALAGGVEDRGGARLRLRSAIAFCNKVSRSRDMARELGSEDLQDAVLDLVPEEADPRPFAIEHRDAGHSAPEREAVLDRLASATPDAPFAVTNVGVFGEGIDTPDLDAVAFIEARRSPVEVVQAVGRVMRLSRGKRMGYILVPVLIPPGQHPEAWLESRRDTEGWQELGQVLCALQSHDARIEHLLGEMLHIAAPAEPELAQHLVGLRTSLATDVWFWEGPAGELEYALAEGAGSAKERLEKAGDLRPAAAVEAVSAVPCGTWLVDEARSGPPRVATFDTLSCWEEGEGGYATAPAVAAVRETLVMKAPPGRRGKAAAPRFRRPAKRPAKDRSPKPGARQIPGLLREIADTGIAAESIRLNLLEKSGLLGGPARDFNLLRETVERAAGCLRAEELEGELRAALGMESISEEARTDSADGCTVAALMFMTGAILHARLEHGEALRGRGVGKLAAVAASGTPAEDLLLAWQRILDMDYRPVFGLARDVLLRLTRQTRRTTGLDQAVRGIAHDAGDIAETYTDMGMDYAGELFNQVMGNQAADGAYFTRPAPAVLLAELVAAVLDDGEANWTKLASWRRGTAFDPACGSGTLLVSLGEAYKRRARQQGADARTLARMHRYLVEEGLAGLDINPVSLQLAGAQMTLGDTKVSYRNMGLARMPYGLDPERPGEPAAAGSLELLTDERVVGEPRPGEQDDWIERTYRGADHVERVALRTNEPREQEGVLDDVVGEVLGRRVAIMNPPFVTRAKLGRKFGRDEQIAIRKRIDAGQAVLESRCADLAGICDKTSTRSLYVALGLRCMDPEDGVLAMVIPTVALTSPSGLAERQILGRELHVRLVVTSHEPGNVNVSQRTSANESLVIGTRAGRGADGPTLFASLDRMPRTVDSAVELAAAIASGQAHRDVHVRAVSAERVAGGDWSAAGWRNPALDEAIEMMVGWDALVRMRDVSGVTVRAPGHGVYMTERRSWPSRRIFNSKAGDAQQRLAGEPDTEVWLRRTVGATPAEAAAHEQRTWERHQRETAGHLLLVTTQRMDSARVNAVVSETPQVGSWWKPVQGIDLETAKAWAFWLNSTAGRLTALAHRGGKALEYPTWNPRALLEGRVPDPERRDLIAALARGFDALSGTPLDRYNAGYTPVRQRLDATVAEALGNGVGEQIAEWARLLNEEPVVCPSGFWQSRASG